MINVALISLAVFLISSVSASPVPGAIPGVHPFSCVAGNYVFQSDKCVLCPAGTAQAFQTTRTSCPACGPMTYTPSTGYRNCLACRTLPANAVSCDSASGWINRCSPGFYLISPGTPYTWCNSCQSSPSTWSNGLTSCLPCPSICGGSCDYTSGGCVSPRKKVGNH